MKRTTVNLDADIVAELDRLRGAEGLGLSQALNALARRGLSVSQETRSRFVQRTAQLAIDADITNIGDALDLLDDVDGARRS